jgi:hypothetical protein
MVRYLFCAVKVQLADTLPSNLVSLYLAREFDILSATLVVLHLLRANKLTFLCRYLAGLARSRSHYLTCTHLAVTMAFKVVPKCCGTEKNIKPFRMLYNTFYRSFWNITHSLYNLLEIPVCLYSILGGFLTDLQ